VSERPRIRRNIDNLSPEELSSYQHALAKLYEISERDPDSIDGYTYFEQLHDGSLGPCEHANDTFLPWHRAHLYLFEQALRRSDPPRTVNVTVPYWDWSALPSGNRYPTAFEDPGSILHHLREDEPICRQQNGGACYRLPFPRQYLEASVLSKPNWSARVPVDGDDPMPSFGGVAGGESDCASPFGLGFGALEQPAHNLMHGEYVGGDMADPNAAALDPIFWSFHAYIDLLWLQWQQATGHQVNTDLQARLCGLYKDREHQPANQFRVNDVLDPAAQLGCTYEYTPAEPLMALGGERLFASHPAVDFALSGRTRPEVVRTLDVTIPKPGFNAARLVFTGLQVATPFSYGLDIYLTPRGEQLRPQDADFRDRYLLDLLYLWRAHHHDGRPHGSHHNHEQPGQHARTLNFAVDVGQALGSLAQTHAGQTWRVWVALAAAASAPGALHAHEERVAGTAAAMSVDTLANSMDFHDLRLRVD
jgi:tyrosinase